MLVFELLACFKNIELALEIKNFNFCMFSQRILIATDSLNKRQKMHIYDKNVRF